jgi:hypothetical protein
MLFFDYKEMSLLFQVEEDLKLIFDIQMSSVGFLVVH